MCNDVSLLSPPLEYKTTFTLFSNFEILGANQDKVDHQLCVFLSLADAAAGADVYFIGCAKVWFGYLVELVI